MRDNRQKIIQLIKKIPEHNLDIIYEMLYAMAGAKRCKL